MATNRSRRAGVDSRRPRRWVLLIAAGGFLAGSGLFALPAVAETHGSDVGGPVLPAEDASPTADAPSTPTVETPGEQTGPSAGPAEAPTLPSLELSRASSAARTGQCLAQVPLDKHFGPTPTTPYVGDYIGAQRSANIVLDPSKLYASTLTSYSTTPVAEVDVTNVPGFFTGGVPGITGLTGSGSWGGGAEMLSTMAMDGGGHQGERTGRSYFWDWGYDPIAADQVSIPRPTDPTSASVAISISVVLNNSDRALTTNTKPERILFVPLPTSAAYRYWSGGEVDQQTGRLYLSGGEDSTIGGTFRLMIFDPVTGDYAESGVLQPKTAADQARFGGTMPASDMAIDGEGSFYIVSDGYSTPNPGTGANQTTKWLVKVEPRTGGGWVYSGVTPLWVRAGTSTYTPVYGADIWGMAFWGGKLYLGGAWGDLFSMTEVDPMTGWTRRLPGSATSHIFDLASAESVAVLNGTIFQDVDRNGVRDAGDVGVADQLVQVYDASGTVRGEQRTNASGEYSFLMPTPSGTTSYTVRVVQPQLSVGGAKVNAAQTGVVGSSLCGQNTVQPQSYGVDVAEGTAPTRLASGSYVDQPRQVLGATDGSQTLSPSQMPMSARYDVVTAQDVTTIDVGISAAGSWGDAGNSATTFNTQAAQNGPRHVQVGNAGDEPPVRLGSQMGWYTDGRTDNGHAATDDGVTVVRGSERLPVESWIFALGNSYTFDAAVQGDRAALATVRAWLSNRNANTFPTTTSASRSGPGQLTVAVPATPAVTLNDAFLRVGATSTSNAIGGASYNDAPTAAGPYAPAWGSAASRTSDWVVDGEVEDYRVRLASAVLHVQVEGAPGAYSFTGISNVSSVAPSATASSGTVAADGAAVTFSSHAITSTASATGLTFSAPAGVEVRGAIDLLDLGGAVVGSATYDTATGRITVPSSLWSLRNDLTLRVRTEYPITLEATKELGAVANGTTSPTTPSSAWEITAVDPDGTATVISGSPQRIERGVVYTIEERLVAGAPADAGTYVPTDLVCADGDGGELSAGVFDPVAGTITPDPATRAISCVLTNTAAEVTIVPVLAGSASPGTGWGLDLAAAAGSEHDVSLTDASATLRARPGTFAATASVPAGTSLVGVERLDLSDPTCAAFATAPLTATADCWTTLTAAQLAALVVTPGEHEVFRVVAAAPAEMPSLPLTGGLGSWVFVAVGGVGLAAAAGLLLARRSPRRRGTPASS